MPAADIAYVVFDHEDLALAKRFFADFGLMPGYEAEDEVGLRAASTHSYCYVARKARTRAGLAAIGMRADGMEMLEQVAAFPEASRVEPIERPGGGWRVRLSSPDGLPFELVHGIEPQPALPCREPLAINHGSAKVRYGEWQRPEFSPASVLRLGHVAILTPDFRRNAEWLQSRFGMAPSDLLFDGDPAQPLGGFFHCRGPARWTDHHTLALFPGSQARVHHTSFEVQDMDAQFLGNKWLMRRGWRPFWGVGRHILGSQVFDYWYDPDANLVEHFTDSDLVQPGCEPGLHQVDDDALAQWGPPMAVSDFVDPWRKPD
jgi:catechol 2,3-dioxygenase-like lactoylglutathione lyase family enzyme